MATAIPAHSVVSKAAFELIGVALLAILADSSKTMGKVIVVFMVGIGMVWLMTSGSAFLNPILSKFQSSKKAA